MAQSQGSNCKVGYQFETTFRRLPTSPALTEAYYKAANFSGKFDLIKSEIIRSGGNPIMPSRGNQSCAIGLSTTLAPQLAALINKGIIGSNTTTGGGSPYTHVGKIGALGSMAWETYLDNNLYLLYLGSKWKEMTLDIPASGAIPVAFSGSACAECMVLPYDAQSGNFTVGNVVTGGTSLATALIIDDLDAGTTGMLVVTGISGTFANDEALTDGGTGAATANIPNGIGYATVDANAAYTALGHTPFDAFEITLIQEGGSGMLLNVKAGQIKIAKDVAEDNYCVGGRGTLGSLPEGRASVSGELTMLFDTSAIALFHKAIRFQESSLKLACQHGTGAGTVGNESFELLVPELKWGKETPPIDKETGIEMKIPFEAYYDNGAEASAVQTTFKTSQATL
jgi:hypothetical protein